MANTAKIPEKSAVKVGLKEYVRQLVKDRPRGLTIEELAAKANVSTTWLSSFIAGKTPNPGVNQIETLFNLLSDEELKF